MCGDINGIAIRSRCCCKRVIWLQGREEGGGRRRGGCCCCHVLEICADQCKDRRRRWGREGEIEKRRLKIDLTRGNYDSKRGVCTFESGSWPGLKKKKKNSLSFQEEALFVCKGVCQVIGSLHVTHPLLPPFLSLSLSPPPSSPSLALYSRCKRIDYFKY